MKVFNGTIGLHRTRANKVFRDIKVRLKVLKLRNTRCV